MQVVAYVRVSTDEQALKGAGLAAQKSAIHAEAAARGWNVVAVFEDAGYSAKNLKRPGIAAALEQLEVGLADALVVAKLDRLSRSMLDFAALMDRSRRSGWGLVALDLNVDTTSPAGEAMVNVMVAFAQLERRLIGQRTKDALAVKRASGVRLGRPASVCPSVAARIRAERAGGATLAAIADGLNRDNVPTARGGVCWRPSSLEAVLRAA